MTQRYVAFLRAINVGGRRVKGERLVELVEGLGFTAVSAYLASGNVVFDTDAKRDQLEAQIAAHLEENLGYDVPTFVRTIDEVADIAETAAFAEAAAQPATKRYVTLMSAALDDEQTRTLAGLANEVDDFLADGTEFYWLRRVDAGESMNTGDVERALGVTATRRTLNTARRLVSKFGG